MYSILIAKYRQSHAYRRILSKYSHFVEHNNRNVSALDKANDNILGKLHERIKEEGRSVLIVGTSSAEKMDTAVSELMGQRPIYVNLICQPNATITELQKELESINIAAYDIIIILAGDNDVHKRNTKKEPCHVATSLNNLANCLHSRSPSCAIFISHMMPKHHLPNVNNNFDDQGNSSNSQRQQIKKYNQFVKEVNNQLSSGIPCSTMWSKQRSTMYQDSSNNLTKDGRRKLAKSWLKFALKNNILSCNM